MRWLIGIVVTTVLLCGAVALAYWSSPSWLPGVAVRVAPRYGLTIDELKLGRPTMRGVHIERLALRRANITLRARSVDVAYARERLERGYVDSIAARDIAITIGPEREPAPAEPLPDPRTLWARIPIGRLAIERLHLRHIASGVAAQGRVSFDAKRLDTDVHVLAPSIAAGYRVAGTLLRDGRSLVWLSAVDGTRFARVDARWHGVPTRLSARVFARPTPRQLTALGELAGVRTETGSLAIDLTLQTAWPLPDFGDAPAALAFAAGTEATGRATVEWSGAVPGVVKNARVRGDLAFDRAEGGSRDSVVVQLPKGIVLDGTLESVPAMQLFGQSIRPHVQASATSPVQLSIDNGQLAMSGPMRVRLGDDRAYVTLDVRGTTRADLRATAAGDLSALQVVGRAAMRLPRTSFARMEIDADLDVRGARRALDVRVAKNARVSLGKVGDWSRGDTVARTRESTRVRVEPRSLEWRVASVQAMVDIPRGDFAGTEVRTDRATATVTNARGQGGMRADARVAFASRIRALDNATPVDGTVDVVMRGNDTRVHGSARIGRAHTRVGFDNRYDLGTKRGQFTVRDSIRWSAPLGAGLLERWSLPGDSAKGAIDVDARVDYRFVGRTTHVTATAGLAWRDVDATYADFRVSGISGTGRVEVRDGDIRVRDAELAVGSAFVGTDVRDIRARLSATTRVIDFESASASVLGGRVSSGPFAYDIASGSAQTTIAVEGVRIEDALALQNQELSGTGIVDGTLPMHIVDNVPEVRGGNVVARPPGGRIAYPKATDYAKSLGQPGIEFAISALADFRYTRLESSIDYDRNNVLALGIKLYGNNPAVENGRIINYNLNVTQNVADLLRSLRATDEVSRRLEQRLQSR